MKVVQKGTIYTFSEDSVENTLPYILEKKYQIKIYGWALRAYI